MELQSLQCRRDIWFSPCWLGWLGLEARDRSDDMAACHLDAKTESEFVFGINNNTALFRSTAEVSCSEWPMARDAHLDCIQHLLILPHTVRANARPEKSDPMTLRRRLV